MNLEIIHTDCPDKPYPTSVGWRMIDKTRFPEGVKYRIFFCPGCNAEIKVTLPIAGRE